MASGESLATGMPLGVKFLLEGVDVRPASTW
jgi:hypothetical protein